MVTSSDTLDSLDEQPWEENLLSRQIIDHAQEGIIVYDRELKYRLWNRYMETMTGVPAAEVLGRHVLEVFPFHGESGLLPILERSLAGESTEAKDFSFLIHQSGKKGWASDTCAPLRNSTGEVIGVIGTVRNITDRKRVEEELAAAQQAAETANRAKTEFLATMSHEIRTPMTGILGMAELLRLSSLTPKQADQLDGIEKSARSLLALINDLLDLSKIEAGRIELEEIEFSFENAINEVLRTQKTQLFKKKLKCQVGIAPEVPPRLMGDPLRFKQILINLLSNAVKFTPQGLIQVTVTVEEIQGPVMVFRLTVADQGPGIKPELLERLFSPFQQADPSTPRVYGGTGLGLSICRRLSELMGGRIWAENRESGGSLFIAVLPFRIQEGLSTPDAHVVAGASEKKTPSNLRNLWAGPPLNILLAEDHPLNLAMTVSALEAMGHTVATVGNGVDAVSKSEVPGFDLLLMDIGMPVMDGIEATKLIRQRERETRQHLPIVALTAFALKGDRERLLDSGFDGFVSKPMQLETLANEMKRCLAV